MKPVLIITPYFAPQTHAAVFRAYKLAKYLPRYGYKPYILTVDTNYLYNEDLTLLSDLPKDVEVFKSRYIEPTLRGARMAFGGQDRTFKATKSNNAVTKAVYKNKTEHKVKKPSLASHIYIWTIENLFECPDRYWTWHRGALQQAKKLIKQHNIELCYTTTLPYTCLNIGLSLKKETGIKWVADFRDPCGYGERYNSAQWQRRWLEQLITRKTMKTADVVTGLAGSYGSIFFDHYGLDEERFEFIPTGVDDDYLVGLNKIAPASEKYLLFVGEFLPEYGDYFFKILDHAREKGLISSDYHIKFIGRKELNQPRVEALIGGKTDILKRCEFIDHMPQSELYKTMQGAHACLLLPGLARLWWCNFAKMVDYIALGKPVIASVPETSEARTELSKAGLGIFLTGDISKDCQQVATAINSPLAATPTDYCQRYLATGQVSAFAKIFDQLT